MIVEARGPVPNGRRPIEVTVAGATESDPFTERSKGVWEGNLQGDQVTLSVISWSAALP